MNISERLESIELKIRQLALKLRQLTRENSALREENQQLQTTLRQRDETLAELRNQLQNVNLTLDEQRQGDTVQTEKFKEQVDHYIQEIDRCIAWLTNN